MKRILVPVLTVAILGALTGSSAMAGQAGGTKNCASQWIKTSGTGQGNQTHTVGTQMQNWSHPLNGMNYSETFFSTLSFQTWTVTTGGPLSSAAANCWFN